MDLFSTFPWVEYLVAYVKLAIEGWKIGDVAMRTSMAALGHISDGKASRLTSPRAQRGQVLRCRFYHE